MWEVERYIRPDGTEPVSLWLRKLRDKRAAVAIDRRLLRIEGGNFGDHRFERDGVWELRIDMGPGYRVYYGIVGERVILLLCGGDKSTQLRDLDLACKYWQDFKGR